MILLRLIAVRDKPATLVCYVSITDELDDEDDPERKD